MSARRNLSPRETDSPGAEECGQSAATTRHILVVDDDSGLRNLLAHFLQGAGYRVSCAADGQAGWEALAREEFDAVVTDHDMPRLTGLGLLRRVRATSTRIPVILISGLMPVDEADLPQLLSPGLALQKPFSLAAFMAGIQSVLPSAKDEDESDGEAIRPDFGRARESAEVHPRDAMVA